MFPVAASMEFDKFTNDPLLRVFFFSDPLANYIQTSYSSLWWIINSSHGVQEIRDNLNISSQPGKRAQTWQDEGLRPGFNRFGQPGGGETNHDGPAWGDEPGLELHHEVHHK